MNKIQKCCVQYGMIQGEHPNILLFIDTIQKKAKPKKNHPLARNGTRFRERRPKCSNAASEPQWIIVTFYYGQVINGERLKEINIYQAIDLIKLDYSKTKTIIAYVEWILKYAWANNLVNWSSVEVRTN